MQNYMIVIAHYWICGHIHRENTRQFTDASLYPASSMIEILSAHRIFSAQKCTAHTSRYHMIPRGIRQWNYARSWFGHNVTYLLFVDLSIYKWVSLYILNIQITYSHNFFLPYSDLSRTRMYRFFVQTAGIGVIAGTRCDSTPSFDPVYKGEAMLTLSRWSQKGKDKRELSKVSPE